MDAALFFTFACALLALAFLPPKYVGNRAIRLFGSLFPSWRFFEEIEAAPRLQYRAATAPDAFGPWRRALPAPRRGLRSLVLNAEGNLVLACHSLVEQLLAEIADREIRDLARASELVSYRLVERAVVYALPPELANAPRLWLQFKLTSPAANGAPAEELLVSEPFVIESGERR